MLPELIYGLLQIMSRKIGLGSSRATFLRVVFTTAAFLFTNCADDRLYLLALLVVGIALEQSESMVSEGDRGVGELRVHHRNVCRERRGEVSVQARHLVRL